MSEAEEFVEWRKAHGWTQAGAASQLGVSTDCIRNWENARRTIRRSVWVAMRLLDETSPPTAAGKRSNK